jgi:hypothetical protein
MEDETMRLLPVKPAIANTVGPLVYVSLECCRDRRVSVVASSIWCTNADYNSP